MKKLLFFLPFAFALSLGAIQPKETITFDRSVLRANGETTDETTEEETSTTDVLEDKDGNGIPDSIEEYYQNTTFYQLTGVALGSLVGLAISIIGLAYNIVKTKNMMNATASVTNNANSNLLTWNENAERIDKDTTDLLNQSKVLLDKITELTQSNTELKEEVSVMRDKYDKLLTQYTQVDAKMNAVLRNQSETAKTTENIKNGVAKRIYDRVTELTDEQTKE